MVIDLTELKKTETPWRKQAEPEEINLEFPDYEFAKSVNVRLLITNSETQYILRGSVATGANTKCVKCLASFELPIEEEIGWVVQVIEDRNARTREEDTEDFWFIEKGSVQLDITDRVREAILVNLPSHPVCKTECRGLCAQCGVNLNTDPCDCGNKKIDGRWGPLQDMLDKQKGSSA